MLRPIDVYKRQGNSHVQLFAKIENQQGIENLDEIIEVTDGIMIARGDMGIEVCLLYTSQTPPPKQKQTIA